MARANVGVGLDVEGARVGLPLTTVESCDPEALLPGMYERARAEFAFNGSIVTVPRRRGIRLRIALGALRRNEIAVGECLKIKWFCVHRWVHA